MSTFLWVLEGGVRVLGWGGDIYIEGCGGRGGMWDLLCCAGASLSVFFFFFLSFFGVFTVLLFTDCAFALSYYSFFVILKCGGGSVTLLVT